MISLKDVWPASHVKITDLETGKVTDAGAVITDTAKLYKKPTVVARSRPKLQLPKIKVITADDLNKGMVQVADDLQKQSVRIYSDESAPKYKLAGVDFSDLFKKLDNLVVSAKPQPPADQYWAAAK